MMFSSHISHTLLFPYTYIQQITNFSKAKIYDPLHGEDPVLSHLCTAFHKLIAKVNELSVFSLHIFSL